MRACKRSQLFFGETLGPPAPLRPGRGWPLDTRYLPTFVTLPKFVALGLTILAQTRTGGVLGAVPPAAV